MAVLGIILLPNLISNNRSHDGDDLDHSRLLHILHDIVDALVRLGDLFE